MIFYLSERVCLWFLCLTLQGGGSLSVIYAWVSLVSQWISWRLTRLSHCGQTKHSQCIVNERRLHQVDLNLLLAAKRLHTMCLAVSQRRSGRMSSVNAVWYFVIKVRDWGIITRHRFSLRDLSPCQIFDRAVFFIFISWNIWFWTSFFPGALGVFFS